MPRFGTKHIAVVLVGLLAVTGCTGNSDATPARNGVTVTCPFSAGQFPSDPCPRTDFGRHVHVKMNGPAIPVPGAKPGGTIRVVSGHPLGRSLDPTGVHSRGLIAIESDLIVRSLTQYVYEPRTFSMVLGPDLATNLGVPNRHFTAWTFTLRKGIRFANGRPITPKDVKFAIERSFDRKSFPHGPSYSNAFFWHGDTYPGPYRSPVPYDGVVIHGRSLTIKTERPFPDMPYLMATPAMSPIPPGEASNQTTYRLHPWASGPYKIARYRPGRSLILVRNSNWDPKTDPGRHQYVRRFVFDFQTTFDSELTRALLADNGAAQRTLTMSDVPAAVFAQFRSRAGDRIVSGPTSCAELWYPDNRKITSVKVRQALAWAYPYKAAWLAGGSIEGVTRIPGWGVTPPGTQGREQYNPISGHSPGITDAAKAKALLKQANALNYTITFPYDTDVPTSVAVKNQIVLALKKAGFNPQPYATTSSNYATLIANPNAPINLRSGRWCSPWPLSGAWVSALFGSPQLQPVPGQNGNLEQFSTSAVDSRILADRLLPFNKQPAAEASLEQRIMETSLPVIPTSYIAVALARGSDVQGARIDSVRGEPTFENLWVGPAR